MVSCIEANLDMIGLSENKLSISDMLSLVLPGLCRNMHMTLIHFACLCCDQGLYSLSGKTSYHKISSRSLEATRFGFDFFQSLWNLLGTSTAALPVKFQSDTILITSNIEA